VAVHKNAIRDLGGKSADSARAGLLEILKIAQCDKVGAWKREEPRASCHELAGLGGHCEEACCKGNAMGCSPGIITRLMACAPPIW
jgi:hypothetical protein